MKSLLRALSMALRYRWSFLFSMLTTLFVAILWGANIGTVAPFVKVIFEGQSLPEWIDARISEAETQLALTNTTIESLADWLGDPVAPADFQKTRLRFRNDRHAAGVGLDGLTDDQWQNHFGRFEPLADNLARPLALRYHGHQFRVYNPEIGDGRGFLFAQMRDG